MAKLTRQELRIIEQTKREGEQSGERQEPSKWAFMRSVLLFVLVFGLMAFVAYVVIGIFIS